MVSHVEAVAALRRSWVFFANAIFKDVYFASERSRDSIPGKQSRCRLRRVADPVKDRPQIQLAFERAEDGFSVSVTPSALQLSLDSKEL
jgi:hypothetical protein